VALAGETSLRYRAQYFFLSMASKASWTAFSASPRALTLPSNWACWAEESPCGEMPVLMAETRSSVSALSLATKGSIFSFISGMAARSSAERPS
jgi:hypothetical protein